MVADASSHWKRLLTTMVVTIPDFEKIKHEYIDDKDFGPIYSDLLNGDQDKHPHYNIHDGFLFRGNKLCLPATSVREHIVCEFHPGGCSVHLGHDKTFALVDGRFYCPCMRVKVVSICERCRTCQLAKGNMGRMQVYISHCLFLMHHGISTWNLC